MKTTNKISKNRKKYLIIILAVAFFVGAGITVYALSMSSSETEINTEQQDDESLENQQNLDAPTKEQVETGNKVKEEFIDKSESGDTDNTAPSISITSASQSQGVIAVRAMVETVQVVGSCELTLERAGQATSTLNAGLQSMGSYAVCKGFDIPTTGLIKGEWKLSVRYINGDEKSSDSRTVQVE